MRFTIKVHLSVIISVSINSVGGVWCLDVQPEVPPPPRRTLNRSRSVDPRTSSSRNALSSADHVGNKNKNKNKKSDDSTIDGASVDVASADRRHRARSVDNRCRSVIRSTSNVDNRCKPTSERSASKSVTRETTGRGGRTRPDSDEGAISTVRRTNSTSFTRAPASGKQVKDDRKNGNQRRAQSVSRQTTAMVAKRATSTTITTAASTRSNVSILPGATV